MDEGEFDYELEDAGNDLGESLPSRGPLAPFFFYLGERQKISPERPRLFQGKEGDRMRDGVPAEWNGHPWGQLCKT